MGKEGWHGQRLRGHVGVVASLSSRARVHRHRHRKPRNTSLASGTHLGARGAGDQGLADLLHGEHARRLDVIPCRSGGVVDGDASRSASRTARWAEHGKKPSRVRGKIPPGIGAGERTLFLKEGIQGLLLAALLPLGHALVLADRHLDR